MKPQLLKMHTEPYSSFSFRNDSVPHVNNRWHLHAELELIYFKNGEGTQFIGDNISDFKSGDVVLVGPSLPHYWRFSDSFLKRMLIRLMYSWPIFLKTFWGVIF
ncbi:AraC family ligand binding domain-containing protein [Niabella hibiscisoli]|uniref:AraC family ligand binding domain-containing protein n=1 Tax=Niabella hibiscisoli TaxID=1825928 RepID=UPI001F100B78|nr:AraC family ligand binding domain-containing protein [Niabella hibiscisoli]MCH5720775.1 AraC family ligand binding domain-containing protein [Niabella hibiscisoli]